MAKRKPKTIKLTLTIAEADRLRKAAQAKRFLDEQKLGVKLEVRLRGWREAGKASHAMLLVNQFIADIDHPEKKVNPLTWNNNILKTFLHP